MLEIVRLFPSQVLLFREGRITALGIPVQSEVVLHLGTPCPRQHLGRPGAIHLDFEPRRRQEEEDLILVSARDPRRGAPRTPSKGTPLFAVVHRPPWQNGLAGARPKRPPNSRQRQPRPLTTNPPSTEPLRPTGRLMGQCSRRWPWRASRRSRDRPRRCRRAPLSWPPPSSSRRRPPSRGRGRKPR